MRSKYAVKNTFASILLELAVALSGIILPRFFIGVYGSSVNGLVSSIGNFITYMGLVEAGVGAAATVELYKPLAEGNQYKINEIVSAARAFYLRLGILFVALDAVLITLYPFIVKNEISDVSFVRMMILALSVSGIVDFFFLGKYRVLLTADQKTYVLAFVQTAGTIVTLGSSILLIELGASAVIVKAVVGIVFCLRTVVIAIYVRRHYPEISFHKEFSSKAFPQRRAALFHQIVGMICNNTDMVLLTVMLRTDALVEVSVYAIYCMVTSNLTALFNSFYKGLTASFGNTIANNDETTLRNSFSLFELMYFVMMFIIYACTAVLFLSFVTLYSAKFKDASIYPRVELVVLFTLCGVVQNIRIPGLTIQLAAGHFKQTKLAAFFEAALNLGISVALVRWLGIAGVLVGTLTAYLYRSTDVIIYNAKNFLPGTLRRTIWRGVRNFLLFAVVSVTGGIILAPFFTTWFWWIGIAVVLTCVVTVLFALLNYLAEPQEFRKCVSYLVGQVRRR